MEQWGDGEMELSWYPGVPQELDGWKILAINGWFFLGGPAPHLWTPPIRLLRWDDGIVIEELHHVLDRFCPMKYAF